MGDAPFQWDEKSDAAWADLEQHIEWAEGFWVVFVFSPSPMMADALQRRTAALLQAKQLALTLLRLDTPTALVGSISDVIKEASAPQPCTWIEAAQPDRPDRDPKEVTWGQAWETFLLRVNERREILRRQYRNGLVLSAPLSLKNLFRNAAPDLWSVRTLALELAPPIYEKHDGEVGPLKILEKTPPSSRPDLALVEARRLENSSTPSDLAIAQAYARAVPGLVESGRMDEAKAAVKKANDAMLRNRKRPAEQAPVAGARMLFELAYAMDKTNDLEGAARIYETTVDLYRRLANEQPDAFSPKLSDVLNFWSTVNSRLGKTDRAIAVVSEVVEIRRKLAAAQPERFVPALASALSNLGALLRYVGKSEKALAAAEEAVEIFRTLARARPDELMPDFAGALNNLAAILSGMGRKEDALAAMEEAVRLLPSLLPRYREKFAAWVDEFTDNYIRFAKAAGASVDKALLAGIREMKASLDAALFNGDS